VLVPEERTEELRDLGEALTRLEAIDSRAAQVVECRFFGGLDAEETAAALGVSRRTVTRDWSAARAWLYAELRNDALDVPL
jgi:RNA polymerase sigma factor (sigma-70 family)